MPVRGWGWSQRGCRPREREIVVFVALGAVAGELDRVAESQGSVAEPESGFLEQPPGKVGVDGGKTLEVSRPLLVGDIPVQIDPGPDQVRRRGDDSGHVQFKDIGRVIDFVEPRQHVAQFTDKSVFLRLQGGAGAEKQGRQDGKARKSLHRKSGMNMQI